MRGHHVLRVEVKEPAAGGRRRRPGVANTGGGTQFQAAAAGCGRSTPIPSVKRRPSRRGRHEQAVEHADADAAVIGQSAGEDRDPPAPAVDVDELRRFDPHCRRLRCRAERHAAPQLGRLMRARRSGRDSTSSRDRPAALRLGQLNSMSISTRLPAQACTVWRKPANRWPSASTSTPRLTISPSAALATSLRPNRPASCCNSASSGPARHRRSAVRHRELLRKMVAALLEAAERLNAAGAAADRDLEEFVAAKRYRVQSAWLGSSAGVDFAGVAPRRIPWPALRR